MYGTAAAVVPDDPVSPSTYPLRTHETSVPGGFHLKTKIRNVSFHLDYREGDGYMLVHPDARPCDIVAAFELASSLGWEELALDESGDEPEVMQDGTTKVVLVFTFEGS